MICKHNGFTLGGPLSVVCGIILAICPLRASAQDDAAEVTTWNVPIVMEEATVRGKVAVLENRAEDRQVLEGLRVEIWSTEIKKSDAPEKKSWFSFKKKREPQRVRKEKLHETETDASGLFSLPSLKPEEYLMVLSKIQFRVTVIPKDKLRAKQDEPKVLLILIPKEVVGNSK